jgi:hypothetical protein
LQKYQKNSHHDINNKISALRQQMLKEIRETQTEKSMNSRLGESSPGETGAQA